VRVAVPWIAGTAWLGGWNYFLNMARVCRRFAPDIEFALLCEGELEPAFRAELAAEKIALLPPVPLRRQGYVKGYLGLQDRATQTLLRDAGIAAVFELIPLRTRYGIPALAWIPDFQHRRLPAFFPRRERLRRDLIYRTRLRLNRHAMLSSHAALEDMQAFIPKPRAQVHIVPFAVLLTEEITSACIADALKHHSLPPVYFFLPNQFWQHKNHEVALRALALAVKQIPSTMLALSGQAVDVRASGYAAGLMQLANDLGISANLRILGTISHKDLLVLTAGAHALVNPSLFEGWSTTVEEAKALGTPMILSDLDVHREQAASDAVYFPRSSPQALAEALVEAMRAPIANTEPRRAYANLRAQENCRVYAQKLRAALAATVADGI